MDYLSIYLEPADNFELTREAIRECNDLDQLYEWEERLEDDGRDMVARIKAFKLADIDCERLAGRLGWTNVTKLLVAKHITRLGGEPKWLPEGKYRSKCTAQKTYIKILLEKIAKFEDETGYQKKIDDQRRQINDLLAKIAVLEADPS